MTTRPWILGISASHNGAFCLLHGSEIRVAIQEERLVGLKRARVQGARRALGLRYCLDAAGLSAADLSMIVLSCQGPAGSEDNDIRKNPDFTGLATVPMKVVSHHLAHAASALATSGCDSAAILVTDGAGSPVADLCPAGKRAVLDPREDNALEHMSLFQARSTAITPLEIHASRWIEPAGDGMRPFSSLGTMYSAAAEQIFGEVMEAGKVMGLAPYGEPSIPVEEFLFFDGDRLGFSNLVQRRFGYRDRWPARAREYRDLAASVQRALEVALLRAVARLRALSPDARLCMAGGVALNSVANQRICEEGGFDDVHIVPYAEDSGVAVGAAYLGLWELRGERTPTRSRTDAHGRTYTPADVRLAIQSVPDLAATQPADLLDEVADRLVGGQIGGWFQGGAELGPRALGARSVICSPCGADTKARVNARVKFREEFRPFAPSVLAEHAASWFDFDLTAPDSPFMLRVVPFREERRPVVPAVVHVDGTGRLQTLTERDNGLFYQLVSRFHARSGVPMLLNTSMNVRGEPLAETPDDALWCLLGTGLDFCVVHDWIVTKRHTFGSILDYVPRVIAGDSITAADAADRDTVAAHRPAGKSTVRTFTPWGESEPQIPARLLPLLEKIDGRRDGHALERALGKSPSSPEITHDLLLLRRLRVIAFLP